MSEDEVHIGVPCATISHANHGGTKHACITV